MANNVTVGNTTGQPNDYAVATEDVSGVHHQKSKIEFGGAGAATPVSDAAPLPVGQPKSSTAVVTSVADATTETTLAAPNGARVGLFVYNDSPADLYLKYHGGVSVSTFTVKLASGDFWEMPQPIFTNTVTAVWASDAGGFARVTELT